MIEHRAIIFFYRQRYFNKNPARVLLRERYQVNVTSSQLSITNDNYIQGSSKKVTTDPTKCHNRGKTDEISLSTYRRQII